MKPCIVPLPIEHSHSRRWPRLSGRVRNRAFWFIVGFFSALFVAGLVGGRLS
jgi:hypothetical protein